MLRSRYRSPREKKGKSMRKLCVALAAVALAVGTVAADDKVVTTKSGLKYIDQKVGDGKEAKNGDTVEVHYTGWLQNGTKFDSSKDRNEPFTFKIGGRVIKGWNEGVQGMKVGGKRKLIIPADLAYGKDGVKDPNTGKVIIPGSAELTFEVELLKIK